MTLRLRRGLPSLRKHRFVRAFRTSLAHACARHRFRVVHYAIQRDHLHLLIEARGREALACGMKSIGARVGRAVNRVFRHEGPVLADRYHHRLVKTPLEARRSLAYVLLNARHHWMEQHGVPPPVKLDEASSGMWFDGWKGPAPPPPDWQCDVASPSTWLLRTGWRKHGLIDPSEVPGVRTPGA